MSKFNLLLNAATKVFSHYYCKHNINFIRNQRSLGGAFNQRQSARVITSFSQFSHQKARKEEQMALPQNISISSATSNPQDNDIRIHYPFEKVTSQIVDMKIIFIQPNFLLSFLSLSPKRQRKLRKKPRLKHFHLKQNLTSDQ